MPRFDLSDPDAVRFCPSCGSGYTARVTRCEACDTALVSRAEVEAGTLAVDDEVAPTAETGEVVLVQVSDRTEADLVAGALERAGVPYLVEFRVSAPYLDAAQQALRQAEGR